MEGVKIKSALLSVYYKDHLDLIVRKLHDLNVQLYSTGGTKAFIEELGIPVVEAEELTGYPAILGGRVKTLHPAIFGGILSRRDQPVDQQQMLDFKIPYIDLVIVDLYPFEETLASDASHQEIIEKIDIGGISLIRAAAKNYKDVVIVSSRSQYDQLLDILENEHGFTTIDERYAFAAEAFQVSSHYDSKIFNYFSGDQDKRIKISIADYQELRYGENPHQQGYFHGNLNEVFEQLWGKEISYNNLLDIDAAIHLINDFEDVTFAILKHNNACGLASRPVLKDAYLAALAGDPLSAFGGVLISNQYIDMETAEEVNKLFFEVLIAPGFDDRALEILKQKKNRILLQLKNNDFSKRQFRSLLNGVLSQNRDSVAETPENLKAATRLSPSQSEIEDLLFANRIVKHSKSNAIVLAKNKQLISSGVGQTSRVDALKHSIEKAATYGFSLQGAVMASDAFFPFADSVEIAQQAGITAVIQPGGSIKDQDSIDYCNQHGMSMVFTGVRHFKH
jgi:phosphoribosylaminoimidazolecarboxamide formyltransferase / IMP cyclohydrolase